MLQKNILKGITCNHFFFFFKCLNYQEKNIYIFEVIYI